jgi:hypothetical protein
MVAIREPAGSVFANSMAANTFAPELIPVNKPSSKASRRAVA